MINLKEDKVFLVLRTIGEDLVSIWSTKELARAAVAVHEHEMGHRCFVKEWKVNVTIPQ